MPSSTVLEWQGQSVQLTRKSMKTLRLRVTDCGTVRLSAPHRTSRDRLLQFLEQQADWIRQRQAAVRQQQQAEHQQVWLWGQVCPVLLHPQAGPRLQLVQGVLRVRAPAADWLDPRERQPWLDRWCAAQVRAVAEPLLPPWAARLQVQPGTLSVRAMRSRWGSCIPATGRICLNSALARRPVALLEYVLVHELVHLREANHGPRFYAWMDRVMPDWPARRQQLRQPWPPLAVETPSGQWSRPLLLDVSGFGQNTLHQLGHAGHVVDQPL